jgi:hypothetical protein
MNFSEEEISIIEDLAGLQYSWREIAVYLGVNTTAFKNIWLDPDSMIRQAYDRGRLIADTDVKLQVQKMAVTGNATQIQIYENMREYRRIEDIKERTIYGKE